MTFTRRSSFSSSKSSLNNGAKNSVEVTHSSEQQAPVTTTSSGRRGSFQKLVGGIKEAAREHHRAVNGAFEALYGNGVYRYGPNAQRIGPLYEAEPVNQFAQRK